MAGFMKQRRKATVRVILPEWDNPTDTMKDVDDWASTVGYEVSHNSAGSIVTSLIGQEDACLILVGDPGEDDVVYARLRKRPSTAFRFVPLQMDWRRLCLKTRLMTTSCLTVFTMLWTMTTMSVLVVKL